MASSSSATARSSITSLSSESTCSSTASSPSPSHPACPACRHQRVECPPDCPLAPYLFADKPDIYNLKWLMEENLIDLGRMARSLRKANPRSRDRIVQCFVFQAALNFSVVPGPRPSQDVIVGG